METRPEEVHPADMTITTGGSWAHYVRDDCGYSGEAPGIVPEPPASPREPLAFSQRNPHWAHIPLGKSRYTIGSAGCAVTAVAMLATMCEPAITPGRLVERLNTANSFTQDGLLLWYKTAAAVDGLEYISYKRWHLGGANMPVVKSALSYGPQIIQVDFKPQTSALDTHFVLALRMTNDGNDIWVCDPWTGDRGTLLELYGQPGWDLARAVYALAEFRVT